MRPMCPAKRRGGAGKPGASTRPSWVLAWFFDLPWPLKVIVGYLALCVLVGIVLGVAQATGLLPKGWTGQRVRLWFKRRKQDDDPPS